MKNEVKLIYFDVCVLSRPFDDQTFLRVRLETEAANLILLKTIPLLKSVQDITLRYGVVTLLHSVKRRGSNEISKIHG